jgi:ubiquinone/menaquinone biosynthesis C-methylase UbiE
MVTTDWLFDELAHAGREHLDPDYVAAYDRKARSDAVAAEEVPVLRNFGLNGRSTLVDLGAGTGALALAAASHCRRVVAVDPSSAMLGVLATRAAQVGLENVEAVLGGFLTYEHRGDAPDFVYSRNALHHLPDFWKALALQRIANLLKPGGVLRVRDLVFAFDPRDADVFIDPWLASAAEQPNDGWTRSELEEHLREEHSTFSWLLEAMLERAGFEIHEGSYGSARIYAAYTCVKAAP